MNAPSPNPPSTPSLPPSDPPLTYRHTIAITLIVIGFVRIVDVLFPTEPALLWPFYLGVMLMGLGVLFTTVERKDKD